MIIDTHCHVIATDTKTYPLKPLFGKQSDWSAEHPLDYPDMVAADKAAGVDKSVLVQASSAYAFDNSYVADSVAALGQKILEAIDKQPLYYTDIAERFSDYDFNTVARAIGHLHKTEKLWQDLRGRMCVRGSKFAAMLPAKK